MVDTPLCLYVFTTQDKVLREFMDQCRAGAVVQNDVSVMDPVVFVGVDVTERQSHVCSSHTHPLLCLSRTRTHRP
jgi:hypothetical protein